MTTPVRRKKHPLTYYSSLITAGTPFSFLRFGDGEWGAITANLKSTGSGSQAFCPELRDELKRVVVSDCPAYYGTRFGKFKEKSLAWMDANDAHDREWHNAAVFADAYAANEVQGFIQAIRNHSGKVIVVGGEHLKRIPCFDRDDMILTKDKNNFSQIKWIKKRLRGVLSPKSLVLLSAGPTAKVLVHDFALSHPDCWFIDVGSLWDALCGSPSRRYHRSHKPGDVKV